MVKYLRRSEEGQTVRHHKQKESLRRISHCHQGNSKTYFLPTHDLAPYSSAIHRHCQRSATSDALLSLIAGSRANFSDWHLATLVVLASKDPFCLDSDHDRKECVVRKLE